MRRTASTLSTWPITTAAPRSLPAGCCRAAVRGAARCFTKWCPPPGPMTAEIVRAGVQERLDRLGAERIDLLQFHWWTFEHPAWLDALHELARLREEGLIGELGVTNFDADSPGACREPACRSHQPGVFSLLDRRAAGDMSAFCRQHGVGLLAYGTLAGGFLSERWLDRDRADRRRRLEQDEIRPLHRRRRRLAGVADLAAGGGARSRASMASRSPMSRRAGCSSSGGRRSHRRRAAGRERACADNRRLFSFALDADDRALLEKAFAATRPIPGDCGDEYRRPPFLTASGDLSHHLSEVAKPFQRLPAGPGAERVLTGSSWEDVRRLLPGAADRRPDSGFGHHGDRGPVAGGGTSGRRGADHLHSRPYRCFRRVSGRTSLRTSRARASTSPTRRTCWRSRARTAASLATSSRPTRWCASPALSATTASRSRLRRSFGRPRGADDQP